MSSYLISSYVFQVEAAIREVEAAGRMLIDAALVVIWSYYDEAPNFHVNYLLNFYRQGGI